MKGILHSNAPICADSKQLVVACFLTAALSGLVGCSGDSESESSPVMPDQYSSSTLPESSSSSSLPESHETIDGITILVDSAFFMEKFHSSSVKIAFNDDETSELNYLEIDGNSVNSLVVTGAPRLLFHYATDDDSVNIDMYSDEQVCNVSMARDTSKIISFLETRGLKGVEFTQDEGYFWHEYVFYMDYSGEMLKAIRADGGYVFNATEWLFIPGYQVGTLTAQDGTNKHVVLIDYEQGGYALILNAPEKEIFYPDIWVGEP